MGRGAVESLVRKIGCVPQTLLGWVQRHEVDSGVRDGVTTAAAQRVKAPEREVKELRGMPAVLSENAEIVMSPHLILLALTAGQLIAIEGALATLEHSTSGPIWSGR